MSERHGERERRKAMRARRGIVERPKRTPESELLIRVVGRQPPRIEDDVVLARIIVFGLLAAVAALPAAVAALVWAAAIGGGQ